MLVFATELIQVGLTLCCVSIPDEFVFLYETLLSVIIQNKTVG